MADRRVSVNLDADVSAFVRGMMTASAASKAFGTALKSNGPLLVSQEKELDRYSGRLRLLSEAAATIGPAFIPLGAGATQALAGLSAGLLAAGTAAGTALLAFQGVGDGLKALNDYQIDPTAEHLKKVEQAFDKLGPAGEDFVLYLDSIGGQLKGVQNLARAGMFPGFEEGIDSLLTMLPQVKRIVGDVANELGHLASEAGEALSGERWTSFFNYIESDAAPTLREFAHSVGNVAEGLGNLLVAFGPLNRDFSAGLEQMTQRFADWARTVSETQGFEDFVNYLRESGPQAMEFLGAISNALIGIVTAAAPFGQAVLPVLTSFADILATIANSPIGPPLFTAAAGFIALNRAVRTFGPGLSSLNEAFLDLRTSPNVAATAAQRFGGVLRGISGAAGVGLFVTSLSETNDSLKAFEGAAGGALAGLAVGGPWGAAIGGAIGLVASLGQAHDSTAAEVDALTETFNRQTGAITENTRAAAVQKAQQEGLLDAAQQLGISTSTVTDAILGNARAQDMLNGALAGYDVDHSITSVDDLRQSFSESEIAMVQNNRAATKLRDELPGMTSQFGSAAEKAQQFAGAMGDAGGAAGRSRRQFDAQADALAKSREAAGEAAQKFITLGDSLDDSKVSLRGWIRDMQEQANALRDFRINAERAADKGLRQGLIAALREAGPEGALRMKQLANSVDGSIGRANRAWQSGQREIRRYVDAVGGVPRKVSTDLEVNSGRAFDAISALKYALAHIPDETVNVSMIYHRAAIDVATQRAGGGTVPGKRHPYADKTLILAAPGEEVITNRHGEADAFRADRASGRIPRYASGGTVGGRTLDDRLAIAEALQQIRDLTRQLKDRVDKGKHKGELVETGIDRRLLALQLASARADLKAAQNREKREAQETAQATVQAVADAKSGLNLTGQFRQSNPGVEVFDSLHDFRKQIEDAGGKVGKNFEALAAGAGMLTLVYSQNAEKISDLTSQIDSIRSTAAGSFTHDAFNGGLADFDLQVAADTNDANSMAAALLTAASKGLDGPLAAALSGSGNLGLAQQFAGLSPAEIAQREASFAAQATAADQLGQVAVNMSGLTQQVAALTSQNQQLAANMTRIEANIKAGITDGTYQGSYQGTKDGIAERDRNRDRSLGGRVRAGR